MKFTYQGYEFERLASQRETFSYEYWLVKDGLHCGWATNSSSLKDNDAQMAIDRYKKSYPLFSK